MSQAPMKPPRLTPANDSSYVIQMPDGSVSTYVGADAVALAQAIVMHSAIEMWIKYKMKATARFKISVALEYVSSKTAKEYRNNREGQRKAADDLRVWIDTMKAAMPVVRGG